MSEHELYTIHIVGTRPPIKSWRNREEAMNEANRIANEMRGRVVVVLGPVYVADVIPSKKNISSRKKT